MIKSALAWTDDDDYEIALALVEAIRLADASSQKDNKNEKIKIIESTSSLKRTSQLTIGSSISLVVRIFQPCGYKTK